MRASRSGNPAPRGDMRGDMEVWLGVAGVCRKRYG